MIQIRWEHFASLLLFISGILVAGGVLLSYGLRAAIVDAHEEELGDIAQELASQIPLERIGLVVAAVMVCAAIALWIVGSLRLRQRVRAQGP